jgi:hypothetical protein
MCAPCDAYIIAAVTSGIREALPGVFPGCRIVGWQPVQKALRGKIKEAVEFVVDWLARNPEELLRFNIVRQAIGIEDAGNFRRNVRRHPDFMEAIANHGIIEAPSGQWGFLRSNFVDVLLAG